MCHVINKCKCGRLFWAQHRFKGLAAFLVLGLFVPATAQNVDSISSLPLPGDLFEMVQNGNYIYAVCDTPGLVTVNVADPTAPVATRTYDHVTAMRSLQLDGKRLYVTSTASFDTLGGLHSGRLFTLDVTDSARPALLGSKIIGYIVNHLAVEGARARGRTSLTQTLFRAVSPSSTSFGPMTSLIL